MNNKRNEHGAVTIFLIIILVPCIAISCIFTDISRVQVSKTMANSAADLALNTLLTNYDGDLSEYYGLIGSCQNIEDFYAVSAEYFLRTISSQGLSEEEIFLLAGIYEEATRDDTIYDFLKVESKTEAAGMITAVENANLANPALLKDQIVEFMKYRAPITIADTLIKRIQDDKTGVSGFLEAEANEPLVASKQEFYSTEADLMQAAIHSYFAIRAYDQAADTPVKCNNAKLVEYANQINSYKAVYEQIHITAVGYLLNSNNLTQCKRVVLDLDEYKDYDIKKYTGVYSSKETAADGRTVIYYINGKNFVKHIEDTTKKIEAFLTAKQNYADGVADLMTKNPARNSDVNPIQWWIKMNAAVGKNSYLYKDVYNSARAMMNKYPVLLVMLECLKEAEPAVKGEDYIELPDDWREQCEELCKQILNYHDYYLDAEPDMDDIYVYAAHTLENAYNNYNYLRYASGHSVKIGGEELQPDEAVIRIATELQEMDKALADLITKLDRAINGDADTPSLTELWNLAKKYGTDFSDYNTTANMSTTELGGQERADIETNLKLQSEINETSVDELKTRLTNIRNQYQFLRDAITALTYGGTPLRNISTFDLFKGRALSVVDTKSISMYKSEIITYASETFASLFAPENAFAMSNTDSEEYEPDLDVDTPPLYEHMCNTFAEVREENVKEIESDQAATKSKQEEYQKAALESASTYRGGGSAVPKSYEWSETFSTLDVFGGVIGLVGNIWNDNLAAIRDDIYVTTYIMEMFSYATYDREGMYGQLSDEQKKDMTTEDPDAYYKKCGKLGDESQDPAGQQGTWVSTLNTDTYNKSLTNQMINLTNNHAYLAEVEYILYGQETPQENLKIAFGQIYTMRFALNTVSAFQWFWTGRSDTAEAINWVARLISGAFGGVVPAAAIKAVLLPILAAVETCKDNSRLSAGMPVELYKAEDDWWITLDSDATNYSGFFDALTEGISEKGKNQDKGFFYSDYLTCFLYSGLESPGGLEGDMYRRLAEVIEANMEKHPGIGDYSLTNTKMYFRLTATLRVKPLMVAVPYYVEIYDDSMMTTTDWCTYTIDLVRGYT